jgi:RHS repeat-associated protein
LRNTSLEIYPANNSLSLDCQLVLNCRNNSTSYLSPPFGSCISSRGFSSAAYRYGFNGKEKETDGTADNYDFGARIYDGRLGKFLSVDYFKQKTPFSSTYQFASNAPISKLDINGDWDIEIHTFNDRGKYGYGILIVKDMNGKEKFRTVVRAQGMKHAANGNNPRNRLKQYGDSPTGTYKFEQWRKDGDHSIYGPNYRLDMTAVSGEIKKSGRTEIQIHGGRQIGFKGNLWNTGGCFRVYDDAIKSIKTTIDELEANDENEKKSRLIVATNDLEEYNGKYYINSELTELKNIEAEIESNKADLTQKENEIIKLQKYENESESDFEQRQYKAEYEKQLLESKAKKLDDQKKEAEKKGISGKY